MWWEHVRFLSLSHHMMETGFFLGGCSLRPQCFASFFSLSTRSHDVMLAAFVGGQKANPCWISLSTSPPAAATALMAASLRRRRRSWASFSRRALVLELPLGATPVMRTPPSLGVKLTKPIPESPPSDMPPPLASRERRLRTLHGVPGMLPGSRPEALLTDDTDAPELWRDRGPPD